MARVHNSSSLYRSKKKSLCDVWYVDIQRALYVCVCECVSTVDVMGHDPYWRPFKVFESTHHKVASLKTVAQDLSQLHRTVDKTIAYDCLSSYMFNTSTWSLLKKRHPHACPKEMWHFAFLYSHSATWWCQNQPQSSAIGSHLYKRVWRCLERQRSRRSPLEQETDNLRKRIMKGQRDPKRYQEISRDRESTEQIRALQNIT